MRANSRFASATSSGQTISLGHQDPVVGRVPGPGRGRNHRVATTKCPAQDENEQYQAQ